MLFSMKTFECAWVWDSYKNPCEPLYVSSTPWDLQVLLAGAATDLSLLVKEVEHAAQDGQQQQADDENRDDHTAAPCWRESISKPRRVIHCVGTEAGEIGRLRRREET